MSKRLEAFLKYEKHPFLHKAFKRLRPEDLALATSFIEENDGLSKGDFELAVNRIFVDAKERPKHFGIILELLSCSNSSAMS